jgi:hypothetical protein
MRRGGDPTWCMALAGKTVLNASWFFAYFPLPFIVSVRSTSLMNVVLIVLLYTYLDRQGFFSERAKLFYLFYPSFMLYAAIGGRDVLIMFCMFMAMYNLIEKRSVAVGLCWILPLFMIKLQNAFMVMVPFAMHIIAGKSRGRMVLAISLGAVFAIICIAKGTITIKAFCSLNINNGKIQHNPTATLRFSIKLYIAMNIQNMISTSRPPIAAYSIKLG